PPIARSHRSQAATRAELCPPVGPGLDRHRDEACRPEVSCPASIGAGRSHQPFDGGSETGASRQSFIWRTRSVTESAAGATPCARKLAARPVAPCLERRGTPVPYRAKGDSGRVPPADPSRDILEARELSSNIPTGCSEHPDTPRMRNGGRQRLASSTACCVTGLGPNTAGVRRYTPSRR